MSELIPIGIHKKDKNNGGGDQNNFVRNLYVNIDDLEPASSKVETINNYLNTLPDELKTLSDTDSKLNIIIYQSASNAS